MLMDNYSNTCHVILKLFECTILPRLTVNFNQLRLKFGFTKMFANAYAYGSLSLKLEQK